MIPRYNIKDTLGELTLHRRFAIWGARVTLTKADNNRVLSTAAAVGEKNSWQRELVLRCSGWSDDSVNTIVWIAGWLLHYYRQWFLFGGPSSLWNIYLYVPLPPTSSYIPARCEVSSAIGIFRLLCFQVLWIDRKRTKDLNIWFWWMDCLSFW